MKETQQDFGLIDTAASAANAERALESGLETSENEAQPLFTVAYAPSAFAFARDANLGLPNIIQQGPETKPTVTSRPKEPGLGTDRLARKRIPIFSGVLAYFPSAIAAVAQCSFTGNEQHHPGTPLHWDHTKSRDHLDCLLRHMSDYTMDVPLDTDGIAHLAKVAWRALAALEFHLIGEGANGVKPA